MFVNWALLVMIWKSLPVAQSLSRTCSSLTTSMMAVEVVVRRFKHKGQHSCLYRSKVKHVVAFRLECPVVVLTQPPPPRAARAAVLRVQIPRSHFTYTSTISCARPLQYPDPVSVCNRCSLRVPGLILYVSDNTCAHISPKTYLESSSLVQTTCASF